MDNQTSETKPTLQASHSDTRRTFLKGSALTVAAAVAGAVAGRMTAPVNTTPALTPTGTPGRFKDKVILVTGGTSGIGRAAAEAYAAEGGRVYFCGRRAELGKEVEQYINASGGQAKYLQTDVREEAQVKAMLDTILRETRRLDVAFNNAGISMSQPLHEISTSTWEDVINTNVRGVYYCMKYQLLPMLKARSGNILVTSSVQAFASRPGGAAYSASKHALLGLVQAAALDYGSHGIRINAILPGTVDTELARKQAGVTSVPEPLWEIGSVQWAKGKIPGTQRLALPHEIAAFAVDLTSDRYPFMTGAAQVIDGGMTASLP